MSTTAIAPFTSSDISGSDVAGLFDPSITDTLTSEERALLTTLLASDDRTDVAIPKDINARDLWTTLELCCRVFIRVRKASAQLKLLIGRALIIIQENPDIYKQRGFRSFDDFMTREDGLPGFTGISRSELYKTKTVAETFPTTVSLGDARDLGVTKLSLLAQVTREGNSDSNEWVEKAKKLTIPQLKTAIYRSNQQIEEGSLDFDTLQITVTMAQKQAIEEFLDDPEIQAYNCTKMPAVILMNAICEVGEQWKTQARAAMEN
jgi:hypothetical protein